MGVTHHHPPHFLTKRVVTYALYSLIPLALLHYFLFPLFSTPPPTPQLKSSIVSSSSFIPPPSQERGKETKSKSRPRLPRCDYSEGKWVKSNTGPRYNGTTCGTIKKGQNCMVHGRPDTGYLYWRWQPKQCSLSAFDPVSFLQLIRNKHVAFVGDSMARNQLESLLCLLATSSRPDLVYRDSEENKFRRWIFGEYNSTISVFWSPFLVKGVEKSAVSGLNHNKLYLDSADERWASQLDEFHIVLFSIGHWFLHPAIYYEQKQILGCHHCPEFNHTEIGFFGVFRKAVSTTLKEASKRLHGSNKLVVLTTFSPAHFEGEWDKAGACPKREPYKEGEKEMEYMDNEMRKIELEEVEMAMRELREKGGRVKIEALDVTKLALLRPDGHPGPYMNPNPFRDGVKDRVQNDCVHWCMPGPIDTWNEILLEMIKRWRSE